jgi:hypothetical protein
MFRFVDMCARFEETYCLHLHGRISSVYNSGLLHCRCRKEISSKFHRTLSSGRRTLEVNDCLSFGLNCVAGMNRVPCNAGQLLCYCQGSSDVATLTLVTNTHWLRRGGFMKMTATCCCVVLFLRKAGFDNAVYCWSLSLHFAVQSLII